MRHKIYLILFLGFLINGCGTGLKVITWVSNPAGNDFVGPTVSHHTPSTLPYSRTQGYAVYPPQSAQALLNYCEARHEPTTQAPDFDACISNGKTGINCIYYTCSIIPAGQGIACTSRPVYEIDFADTDNFVGFSPSDNQTLLDYCNVKESL